MSSLTLTENSDCNSDIALEVTNDKGKAKSNFLGIRVAALPHCIRLLTYSLYERTHPHGVIDSARRNTSNVDN